LTTPPNQHDAQPRPAAVVVDKRFTDAFEVDRLTD
jgi:hypothetical protein